jgi:ribosomal protein S12 methylthiotransferase accessory factor
MTGKHSEDVTRFDDKSIPRFAPNFTVYLLPPDTVSLYSEHRKFFLRGELYCELAAAIADGKHSFRKLVREFAQRYPADLVNEALKRLSDRGFITAKPSTLDDTAAAYWASLGLSTEEAESNLQNCRIRVKSIDVKGEEELTAALTALGARVVKRNGDLTVTLVNDYLESHLAELNEKHLAHQTPWLLAQPSGIFPLVGPILRPGKGACWTCLTDRMTRNREVKAMLDRGQARRIKASPLAHDMLGQSGIQLAAIEIAKAIATEFRTDLTNHIISLDLLGSTILRHHVAARPQCPSCGSEDLRDPSRPPKPLELGAQGHLLMTSGGYRTVSSGSTVARFRKHVSSLTGVVSRLERINVDLPLNTNFVATHNFSFKPQTLEQLRAGLSGGSFGKGSTTEQAEASALMEAIERYSGIYQGDEIRSAKRFTDFPPGDAIHPNDVLLYSKAQSRQAEGHDHACGEHCDHDHDHDHEDDDVQGPVPFDPSVEIDWSPVWSLRDGRFKYLPTSLLYFYAGLPGYRFHADSNGCAAGNTVEEAIVQGFLELVERDAYAIWWYNRLQRPQVDLTQFDDPYIHDLKALMAETGRNVWALDVTSDLGVPTFVTVAQWTEDGQEFVDFGAGAHFDPHIALLRAMTELNQFLSIGLMGGRSQTPMSDDDDDPEGSGFRLEDFPYLIPNGTVAVQSDLGEKFGRLDTREQVLACVDLVKEAGLDFLVLDQTRPDIEVPVVRVIVPGLRHFYRRFAPGRLYDVPVKLGLLDRPLAENELNPLHPQT